MQKPTWCTACKTTRHTLNVIQHNTRRQNSGKSEEEVLITHTDDPSLQLLACNVVNRVSLLPA